MAAACRSDGEAREYLCLPGKDTGPAFREESCPPSLTSPRPSDEGELPDAVRAVPVSRLTTRTSTALDPCFLLGLQLNPGIKGVLL